jgi:serine protease Do
MDLHDTRPRDIRPHGFRFIALSALSLALWAPGAMGSTSAPTPQAEADADRAMILAADLSAAFKRVAREVTPAVANITAYGPARQRQEFGTPFFDPYTDDMLRRFFGDDWPGLPPRQQPQPRRRGEPLQVPQVRLGTGSGIVVSEDGYLLTNNHVIESATRVEVVLSDNRKFDAEIVGRDPETDLAVLRIDAKGLPAARLGDSDKVEVGEWVLAIGNPFGLSQTVTAGIISAKGRELNASDPRGRRPMFEDFLQTDAAINPGNSGGALVNLRGEVIGVNTAIFTRTGGYMGLGFAIPSSMARSVLEQLKTSGAVARGWLGVGIQDLDHETAASLGFNGTSGALITSVQEGSPAAAAGIKVEDIVLSIDGRPTPSRNALRNIVATTPPGRTVNVEIFRNNERKVIAVTLGSRDEALAAVGGTTGTNNPLGVSVATLTPEIADRINAGNAQGVVVLEIAETSRLRLVGLQVNDVILAINGRPTPNVQTFNQVLSQVDFSRGVRLLIRSQGVDRVVTLTVR